MNKKLTALCCLILSTLSYADSSCTSSSDFCQCMQVQTEKVCDVEHISNCNMPIMMTNAEATAKTLGQGDDTLGIYNLCTVEFADPNLKPIIVSVDQCVLDMTTLSTTYYDGVSSGYWGDLCEPWA